MKANFITTFADGSPVLPELEYTEDGERKGGFACVSYAPADTVIVQVHTSPATIAAMKDDDAIVWLEDIPEDDEDA